MSRSLLEPLLGVMVSMTRPSAGASPSQWKWASKSPGGADLAGTDDEPQPGVVQGRQVGGREHAGVSDDDEVLDAVGGLEGLHDGDDRGGLGLVPFPAADLEGEAGPVDQQADDDLGVDPPLFGVADLAQLVLTLGLEVERGHVIQAQGKAPTGGDVLEQGPRQALAVAPLDTAPQGAEQGPQADRLQSQVAQDAGDLGLGSGLDQAGGDHLLKGPITPSGVPQSQAGIGLVQNVPQQARALGLHRGAHQAGASRRWFQGLQVQQPLTLLGSDLLPPDLGQGRRLGLVVG